MGTVEAELEALAEALVTEAMAGYDKLLPPAAQARLREHLIDELLCTRYGRARLRRLVRDPVTHHSEELATDGRVESPMPERKREGA
jgi:hypothetical protein